MTDITGVLEVGQTLTGVHTFDANGGDQTDASIKTWLGVASPDSDEHYVIVAGDVGNVLAYSVTARNGVGVQGNRLRH